MKVKQIVDRSGSALESTEQEVQEQQFEEDAVESDCDIKTPENPANQQAKEKV